MRKIITWIVKKPGVMVIVFLSLILAGVFSYFELDKQEDPNFEVHEALITTTFPGAGSEEVEDVVTAEIESSIQGITEIDEITSNSYPNVSIINLKLHDNVDIQGSWDEVQEKLNKISLPEYVDEPELDVDVANTAFSIIHLSSFDDEMDWDTAIEESEDLERELNQVIGINNTEILGLPERRLSIELDLSTMAEYGLSWKEVLQTLEAYQFQIPEGSIIQDGKKTMVKTTNRQDSIEEIEDIPVFTQAETGDIIYLKDLSNIRFGIEDTDQYIKTGQDQSVSIVAYGNYNTDARKLGKEIQEVTEEWNSNLPSNFAGQLVFDQSENVNVKFSELFSALLIGMLIVILVCFLTLSFRTALITGITIPVSVIISLFFMNIFGIALHQISLAALIVVIGILVDDSIVANENIERHLLTNHSKGVAKGITTGIQQIAPSIIVSTLCLMIGFAPLIYLGGDTGQFIRALPQILIVTLFVSTIVALLLVPSIRSVIDRNRNVNKEAWSNKLWKRISKIYQSIFGKLLKFYRPLILSLFLISTVLASLVLFLDVQFFPKAEERKEIMVDIELPTGSKIEDTNEHLNQVVNVINETENIDSYISYLGQGLPHVYYNEIPPSPSDSVAQVLINVDRDSKKDIDDIVRELRQEFNKSIQDARVNVRQFEQGPPTGEPIQIRITGDDLDKLSSLAEQVTSELGSMDNVLQESNSVGIPQKILEVDVDYDSAVSAGVVPIDVALTNRLVLEGEKIGEYSSNDKSDSQPIMLESSLGNSIDVEDMESLMVPTQSNNGPVSLDEVASIEESENPALINRYNEERVVFISAYLEDETELAETTEDIHTTLNRMESDWEEGYSWNLTGEEEERGKSFDSLYKFFFLSVSMIFALLYILYHSLWRPFIVMVSVYMSVGGAMLGLYLTNQPLGFMSLLGLIGLSGVVVRNGMILVEFTDQLIQKGFPLQDALIRAGGERIRPIAITTLTTVGGMLPMAIIGGSLWAPLAITIISGLIYSALLTVFIIPSLYYWFAKKSFNPAN